jgi:hypothetical protein
VGGSATFATAWITQRTRSKRELIGAEIHARETLYGEFIRACSKLVLYSFTHTLDKAEKLLPVYEILNRIRLCASDAVLTEADEILKRITEQYYSPNLSVGEFRMLVQRKAIKLALLVIHHRTIKPALCRGRRNFMPGFGAQAKPFVFHD